MEAVDDILDGFRKNGIPISYVEKRLGFSNGLLSKSYLSEEKLFKLKTLYAEILLDKGEIHRFNVYRLRNPITDEIFYIGVTSRKLCDRLLGHIAECTSPPTRKINKRKAEVISSIIKEGKSPIIEPIDFAEGTDYMEASNIGFSLESKYIYSYLAQGCPLVNKYSELVLTSHRNSIQYKKEFPHKKVSYEDELSAESIENDRVRKYIERLTPAQKKKLGY